MSRILLCAAFACAGAAAAQDFPNRPITILCWSEPGSPVDYYARIMARLLTRELGQNVVVENRTGADGVIAVNQLLKQPADGYTLLTSAPEFSINPSVKKKMPFDALKDFAPIMHATSSASLVTVHPSLPVKSVKCVHRVTISCRDIGKIRRPRRRCFKGDGCTPEIEAN